MTRPDRGAVRAAVQRGLPLAGERVLPLVQVHASRSTGRVHGAGSTPLHFHFHFHLHTTCAPVLLHNRVHAGAPSPRTPIQTAPGLGLCCPQRTPSCRARSCSTWIRMRAGVCSARPRLTTPPRALACLTRTHAPIEGRPVPARPRCPVARSHAVRGTPLRARSDASTSRVTRHWPNGFCTRGRPPPATYSASACDRHRHAAAAPHHGVAAQVSKMQIVLYCSTADGRRVQMTMTATPRAAAAQHESAEHAYAQRVVWRASRRGGCGRGARSRLQEDG